LAAFLAAFSSNTPGASGAGGFDDVVEDPGGRKQGKSSAVMRCPYHAPRTTVSRTVVTTVAPCRQISDLALSAHGASPSVAVVREQERLVALLRSGTADTEWKQLGGIDIDDAMCDLFAWLGDRGLCSSCIDAVTGALLEVRKAVAGTDVCTCSRCNGRCSGTRNQASKPIGSPQLSRGLGGGPAELVRVQGRLRAICGVYRLEPQVFNGRPVYKKERIEAYLLHTSLKDWMISGRPDAGGSRCEGFAYVYDSAESPDETCGVWKVSGPRGWEEDRSLQVTAFAELPEQLRAGIGYDDGSAIAKCLAANERGILVVPLCEQEVLEDVLWAPEEPPPGRSRSGGCAHILTPETVQRELRCWLRWLLRDRLEAQRRRILAQAQVGASLCRLFACAALQQLEQAAVTPAPGARARDKKGRLKKGKVVAHDDDIVDGDVDTCIGEAEILDLGDVIDVDKNSVDFNDGVDSNLSASSQYLITPATVGCIADSDESTSTRASSEEPPDARSAVLARGARRLTEQMGWRPEVAGAAALNGAEVAAWHEQHPRYRQLIREERQKLKTQFQKYLSTIGSSCSP